MFSRIVARLVRPLAAAHMTAAAHRPVTFDVDAVAVDRIGQLALALAGAVGHVRSLAQPLVMGGLHHLVGLFGMAGKAVAGIGAIGEVGMGVAAAAITRRPGGCPKKVLKIPTSETIYNPVSR